MTGQLLTKVEFTRYYVSSDSKFIIVGTDDVMTVSTWAKERYIHRWSKSNEEAWPPDQSKTFTQLTIIHNIKEGGCEPLKQSKLAKGIGPIIAPLEKQEKRVCILIEGEPGMGKSVLLSEIAYLWAKKLILQHNKLVILISLQDPAIQKLSDFNQFLQLFCQREFCHQRDTKVTKISSACAYCLSKNGGKDIALLLDDYDECPETLQKDKLIFDIIKRKILPNCSLIVSSRSCASTMQHCQVTTRVEILGFASDEIKCYINTLMKGQSRKIKDLTQSLSNQSSLKSFIYIPFNMVILVYLYKHGISVPKNFAELYNSFVCHSICRYLNKYGIHNITKLTDLSEPYSKIVQQLSKFSFEALNNNKYSFTYDEIKEACSDGYGLLQSLQYFGLLQEVKHLSHSTTYNFINYSVQEFLAAFYISTLQSSEVELRILEERFWYDNYFNVFSTYIALTRGQRPSFLKFLLGNKLLNSLEFLRLYCYYSEAGCTEMCSSLDWSQIFVGQAINLQFTRLTATDMKCLVSFLTWSSHKVWQELNLYKCYIQDYGLHILHHGFFPLINVNITSLQLSYNGLTETTSSWLSDIVINCNVKKLRIDGNHSIGENQQLYAILTDPSTALEQLYMVDTKLSTRAAFTLFISLLHNDTLKELVITDNNVTDDACVVIATALENNSSLVKLWMWNNPIHSEMLVLILKGLEANNTLASLGFPNCPEKTKLVLASQQNTINKNRMNRGCKVKLVIDFM